MSLLFEIFYLNEITLNVGFLAVNLKMCPYASEITMGVVRVVPLFTVEQLQYLPVHDIITTVFLLYNLRRDWFKFTHLNYPVQFL